MTVETTVTWSAATSQPHTGVYMNRVHSASPTLEIVEDSGPGSLHKGDRRNEVKGGVTR